MRRIVFTCLALGFLWAATAVAQSNSAVVRVALVSSCGDSPAAAQEIALAETALSHEPGIALVERSQVEKILEEQHLQLCGLSSPRQALAAGKLLSAEIFAAVENYGDSKGALGLVVFDAVSGVRLWDASLPGGDPPKAADGIVDAVRHACAKRRLLGAQPRTACLLGVRNLGLPREFDGACEAVGRMLERRLLNSPDLALLERQRLEQINHERDLPGHAGAAELPPSLVLLDLEITRAPDTNGLLGTIFLSDTAGKILGKVAATLDTAVPGDLVEPLLAKLLDALKAAPPATPGDRANEAERFLTESRFLRNDGDLPGALRTAEAAVALDPERAATQLQLALCLERRAEELLPTTNGVKGSLPFAERSVELCRRVRVQAAAARRMPDLQLFDVEELLSPRMGHARGYWERVLALAVRQDAETKQRLLEFQSRLREVKVSLQIQLWHSLITNNASARDFGEHANYALQNLEKFVSSSEQWTADTTEILSLWLDVYEKRPMGLGGWELLFNRTLARFGCELNGCGTKGFTQPGWEDVPAAPRLVDWQLSPRDLERLQTLFPRLQQHADPVVQCYGRIAPFALATRGKTELDDETLRQYLAAKEFIREKIAAPASRKPEQTYHGLFYVAARDLIDLAPDASFRRREHLDLFELSLQRRELVYYTAQMACDPDARRFMQYLHYPEPFPLSPVGFTADDCPALLGNAQRALALLRSTNRVDVDAAKFAFLSGSFEHDLLAMCSRIYAKRPDLATNTASAAPWTQAQTLFTLPEPRADRRIAAVVVDAAAAYAVITRSVSDGADAECVRIPFAGKSSATLATLASLHTNKPPDRTVDAVVEQGTLYVLDRDHGVRAVPLDGSPPRLIDEPAGLLTSHVRAFTVAGGKLYAMLAEGHLVAYDLNSHRCEILASKKAREQRSPLDAVTGGFDVMALIHDAPRQRVLFTTRFGERRNCFEPIGLWQIDTASGAIKQLLEVYYPARWMALNDPDHLLLFCPRNEGDTPCHAAFYSLVDYDLRANAAQLLWAFNADRPAGPTLPIAQVVVRRAMHAFPPFVVLDDWLWMNCEGHGRLSLKTKAFEDFSPPEKTETLGDPGWHTLIRLDGGKQILAADDRHVWLLTTK